MKKTNTGYTLIEILVGILIFSIVIIGGFKALSAVTLGKIKLVEQTDMTKDMVYFSEKLFEEIKTGGTIDYEEYFNRMVVGTQTQSGHYSQPTGFGNFGPTGSVGTTNYGANFYYCRSDVSSDMGTQGCYNTSFNTAGASVYLRPQAYGQYSHQFIDYNSNMNADLGDENADGNVRGDDDDENLGLGPIVFTGATDVKEIYLISGDKKKRTLLRWSWKEDPFDIKPPGLTCNDSQNYSTGCLGTIEILKLEGKDWGINHNNTGNTANDGVIDTWIIDPDFVSGSDVIAGSSSGSYRQPLFPDTVSVSDFKVYLYPNIDVKLSWKDRTASTNLNPYAQLSITLQPSWKKRAGMKGTAPVYTLNTTINLVDYFTK